MQRQKEEQEASSNKSQLLMSEKSQQIEQLTKGIASLNEDLRKVKDESSLRINQLKEEHERELLASKQRYQNLLSDTKAKYEDQIKAKIEFY